MKNKFDKFLLSLLWFLASTLTICFWFNIQYGFNIFSDAHWRHLAYMQATQTPVKTSFYISVTFAIILVIGGLYMLVRPHFRKINLDTKKTDANASAPSVPPQSEQTTSTLTRPKRLKVASPAILPTISDTPATSHMTAPVIAPVSPTAGTNITPAPQKADDPELTAIFQDAGYTTKPSPRISGLQTSLMALGSGETVWVGAIGIETSTLQSALAVMAQIFQETLEDIPITIHGFVVDAYDAPAPKAPDILTFANNEELRSYISANPNPPIGAEDAENFEAFSSYISTVIDYLRKI